MAARGHGASSWRSVTTHLIGITEAARSWGRARQAPQKPDCAAPLRSAVKVDGAASSATDETGAADLAVAHGAGGMVGASVGATSGREQAKSPSAPNASVELAKFLVLRQLRPLLRQLEQMRQTVPAGQATRLLLHVLGLPRALVRCHVRVFHREVERLQMCFSTIFRMDNCGCSLLSCRVRRILDRSGFLHLHLIALSRHTDPCPVRAAHRHITPERAKWPPEGLVTYLEDEVGLTFRLKSLLGIER